MRTTDRNTLVVVCHPKPSSLARSAAARVHAGLEHAGHPTRVLDLDELGFDPVLKVEEVRGHFGSPVDRPDLAEHFEALRWCRRLVLVYPTWFSGQPAMLKGWFDRVWMNEIAFVLPDGSSRIRGQLRNIKRIDVVTSHGSTRRVNFIQGNGGRIRLSRTLRMMCSRTCRFGWLAIYDVDNKTTAEIEDWLEEIQAVFSRRPGLAGLARPRWPAWLRGGS